MAKAEGRIFQEGDTVRLNELSKASAKLRDRRGVVVGPSRVHGKFRVLWKDLKRPQIVDSELLEHANGDRSPITQRDVELATISEELERIRDARFERHLKWPREVSLQAYQGGGSTLQNRRALRRRFGWADLIDKF